MAVAFTLNGIGTRYQGHRWLPDGTYITTKWFVVVWVPVIPLGSVRVLQASSAYGSLALSGQSLSVQKVPLDTGMVLRVYAWIAGVIVVLALLSTIPGVGR
jgi:hypothetical protein